MVTLLPRGPTPPLADRGDIALVIPALEDSGSGDQHIRSGLNNTRGVFCSNSAVDLDIDRACADERAYLAQLVDGGGNESLAPETRVDRHNENEINQIDHMLDTRHRRGRVYGDSGLLAKAADRLQRPMNVRAGFDVHCNDVRSGFRESL